MNLVQLTEELSNTMTAIKDETTSPAQARAIKGIADTMIRGNKAKIDYNKTVEGSNEIPFFNGN